MLRAAGRLFLRNGFVATPLSEIADEAGLSKGAVYSNFESKEDLFLALLQGEGTSGTWGEREELAPSDPATGAGDDAAARMADWGRTIAGRRPSRSHVALFLEVNAFALRNSRTRSWVASHNQAFFVRLGERLQVVLDAPDADAATLGLYAQSLYVGLLTHGAFAPEAVGEEMFERFYALLPALAVAATPTPARRR